MTVRTYEVMDDPLELAMAALDLAGNPEKIKLIVSKIFELDVLVRLHEILGKPRHLNFARQYLLIIEKQKNASYTY